VKSIQKQPSCEKVVRPKSLGEKKLKGGSQEMAAANNNAAIIISINIIAAISWPPPFSPTFFTQAF